MRRAVAALAIGLGAWFATLATGAASQPAGEEAVAVAGLAATFVKPAGADRAVLIVPGSGATDRDGNGIGGLRTDAYKLLAAGLARAGVASLRYDKRGIGKSLADANGAPVKEDAITIETSAADAAALAGWLARQGGIASVTLAGHSEGGIVALLAARQQKVDRVVLLASPGRPLGVILRQQFTRQPLPEDLASEIERILVALESGGDPGAMKPPADQIFRPSVQPFLRSVLTLDPAPLVKQQAAPILVIGGGHDMQIGRFDLDALAQARPGVTVHWEPRLTHTLKELQDDDPAQIRAYTDPSVPVMPALIDRVVAWVKQ